tara:strand:+ start:275 stop:706 length:432 start_codon:yes stop_codon:yes gene_type:complete
MYREYKEYKEIEEWDNYFKELVIRQNAPGDPYYIYVAGKGFMCPTDPEEIKVDAVYLCLDTYKSARRCRQEYVIPAPGQPHRVKSSALTALFPLWVERLEIIEDFLDKGFGHQVMIDVWILLCKDPQDPRISKLYKGRMKDAL